MAINGPEPSLVPEFSPNYTYWQRYDKPLERGTSWPRSRYATVVFLWLLSIPGKFSEKTWFPQGFLMLFCREIGNANPEIPMLNRPAINIEMIWDYDRWCCPLLFVANIPIVEFSKNSSVSQPKNPQPAPLLLFHPWAKEGIFVKSSCLEILCPLPSLNKTSQLKYPW